METITDSGCARADLAADRDAIRHLLARYTHAGDRGRLAELAACFAADGQLEYPGNTASGPAAIAHALGQGSGTRNPALRFVRHHITNPLIEMASDGERGGDGNRASARSYFTVHTAIGPDHSGTYTDRLVRTPSGWRFAHRRVLVDWQSPHSLFAPMVTRAAAAR